MELTTHHYFELAAALSGSYYWLQTKDQKIRPFLWYLWLTVAVETIALYTYFLQGNVENSFLLWLKNSPLFRNTWLYNIYGFVGLILLGLFFMRHTNSNKSKMLIKVIVWSCSLFAIGYFAVTGRFFVMILPYDDAVRTFAIFLFVLLFLIELMKSDEILEFYKSHVFYISLAIMIWNICLTPLFIFDGYYKKINEEFVEFRWNFLLTANIILYSCYTFAFLFSLHHKGKLVLKK